MTANSNPPIESPAVLQPSGPVAPQFFSPKPAENATGVADHPADLERAIRTAQVESPIELRREEDSRADRSLETLLRRAAIVMNEPPFTVTSHQNQTQLTGAIPKMNQVSTVNQSEANTEPSLKLGYLVPTSQGLRRADGSAIAEYDPACLD